MVIEWREEWELKHDIIDKQHMKLVSIINKISYETVPIQEIVEELIEYAAVHFSDEESLMIRYGYPEFQKHQKEHRLFKESILEISFDFIQANDNKMEIDKKAMLLEKFCFLWFKNHFLQSDKKFIDFINGGDVNNKPEK